MGWWQPHDDVTPRPGQVHQPCVQERTSSTRGIIATSIRSGPRRWSSASALASSPFVRSSGCSKRRRKSIADAKKREKFAGLTADEIASIEAAEKNVTLQSKLTELGSDAATFAKKYADELKKSPADLKQFLVNRQVIPADATVDMKPSCRAHHPWRSQTPRSGAGDDSTPPSPIASMCSKLCTIRARPSWNRSSPPTRAPRPPRLPETIDRPLPLTRVAAGLFFCALRTSRVSKGERADSRRANHE